uniref:Mitochondrial succinate dehydrogenase subunit 3 n=2 Tax=Dystaenia TaxID=57121 RepID=A0AAF0Z4H6_9APIA|nr:mitochondrial succinate dehydrogenase subunit 3 [Dystaenia ibukiensis]WPD96665.1 mitochondrial succinate dehydrogenase subunit 3 [Dystaenia takesimana]WPF70766.1 succinate dehydrogenase subunit 3 [Dystaenia ibukiensis]
MALRAAISRRVVNRPSWLYATRSFSNSVQDPNPTILNPLGLGVYGGNSRNSELAGILNTQYLFLGGNVNPIGETSKLAFGENSDVIKEKRDDAIQALSGTAAFHPLVDFQKRLCPDMKTVVRENEKQTASVKSQLQQLVRPMYRNPSVYGPLIGSTVGKSFSLANIRTTHSQAGVTSGNGEFSAKLRPLSPHLTVYKPQSTSTSSIFHRIAYIYMGVAALFYYLLYLKMGMICFTYEKFYQFFYYSSELFPIINEISVVALAYYLYKGAEQFMKFR